MKENLKQDVVENATSTENISVNPWSVDVHIPDPEKTLYDMKKDDTIHSGVGNGLILPDTLGELKYILQDVLAGDKKALETPEMKNINFANIVKAIEWLGKANDMSDSMKSSLLSEGWRLNFKCKPPTMKEFLTEKYLGPTAEHIYPFIYDNLIEFWDPLKPYRTLVLTPHIGWGKSFMSVVSQLFTSVHQAMMWHPYKFYGLSPATMFTQCLGGWNQKKASELLLEPFLNVLESSPYFKRVRTHTDLLEAAGEEMKDCLHWTTSTPTAQPLDSKILMADGSSKPMGEIKIGDKIKSPSEGVTEVINIPFHDIADCYEIELEDGRTVRCSDQHLWKVRRSPESEWEVRSLRYIIDHPEFEWEIIELDDFMARHIPEACKANGGVAGSLNGEKLRWKYAD